MTRKPASESRLLAGHSSDLSGSVLPGFSICCQDGFQFRQPVDRLCI